jgi:hypothetical protein
LQPLFELIYLGLSDEDPEVRSNAAFAAGVLIENMDSQMGFDDVVKLLTVLKPFFDAAQPMPPAVGAAKDNASGCVARVVLKNAHVVPLDQVLPILFGALPLKVRRSFSLFSSLHFSDIALLLPLAPFQNDFIENRVVFKCIFHLFQESASDPKILPVLMAHIDHLLAVFAYVLDESRADQLGSDETRQQLIALVRHLSSMDSSMGPKIEAAGLAKFLQ